MRRLLSLLLCAGMSLTACKRHAPSPQASPAVALADAQMTASLDRAAVAPGDLFTLTYTVEHNPDVDVDLEEQGSSVAGFAVEDSGREPPRDAGGRLREIYWYRLRAQVAGSYVLQSLPATYRVRGGSAKLLRAEDVYLEVKAGLPSETDHLHDIKPLQAVHYQRRWVLIAGITAAAAVVLALAAWWWRRRRRRPARVAPPLAHEVALRALRGLAQPNVANIAEVRWYYFAISEVLRTYVEARFHFNATDLTTEEILARLPTLVELQADEQARLKEFLADTDRVKFAGYRPREPEVAQSFERALRFVEATQMVLTGPPPSSSPPPPASTPAV